jgi:hypothetical protein
VVDSSVSEETTELWFGDWVAILVGTSVYTQTLLARVDTRQRKVDERQLSQQQRKRKEESAKEVKGYFTLSSGKSGSVPDTGIGSERRAEEWKQEKRKQEEQVGDDGKRWKDPMFQTSEGFHRGETMKRSRTQRAQNGAEKGQGGGRRTHKQLRMPSRSVPLSDGDEDDDGDGGNLQDDGIFLCNRKEGCAERLLAIVTIKIHWHPSSDDGFLPGDGGGEVGGG